MALLPTPFAFLQPDSGGPQLSVNGSHPLFPLAFNHSPVAFHHPESTLFDEEQQQTQLRQLQQLRQAQLKMDGLQAQTFPSSTNFMDRKRNRNTDRRQQRLNHELDQDFSLASLPSTHPDDFVTGSDSDGSSDQSQAGRPDASSVLGPIAALDGNAPVVPVLSLPIMRNGTLIQLPILWTAMSLALGVEIRGEIIRGLPCIKRLNQLFCPTAGTRYPGDPIERFIDENKALIRRMYGEFQTPSTSTSPPLSSSSSSSSTSSSSAASTSTSRRSVKREAIAESMPNMRDAEFFFGDLEGEYPSIFDGLGATKRPRRQANRTNQTSNKLDACESTVEVVTPYWAANSSGKIRAIVNTQHFEQAVHQEVCSKPRTARCGGDCSCEQKYKWHRLLAYDPDNDCKGIFMDWFLFPSCCVCRCLPLN